jgi:hypothetical protein
MLELMQMCADLTQLTAQHRGDVFSTWTVETSSTDKRLQAGRLKAVNWSATKSLARCRRRHKPREERA